MARLCEGPKDGDIEEKEVGDGEGQAMMNAYPGRGTVRNPFLRLVRFCFNAWLNFDAI